MQANSQIETAATQLQTVKIFIVGSDLLGESILNLVAHVRQVEIIGRSDRACSADAIFQLQPQVVIHSASANEEDCRLIEKIRRDLQTCYIALGDSSDLMFRIRCSAAGAYHIFDQRNGLSQVLRILQFMVSKLRGDNAPPPHSGLAV